jgi:enoyl-CoA hydratase/carnithine racemase
MHTEQCKGLKEASQYVRSRPIKVIVLFGGTDFWSNGIHLNVIEAASSPADESWRNINAIDDLVLEIINTTSCLTVSALWGAAGAGGAMMSLAADRVWARAGCVVNPHYKTMGLFGSEYWTYSLPKRVGPDVATELTESALPVGMQKAKRIGLIDEIMPNTYSEFVERIKASAEELANHDNFGRLLNAKIKARERDEMTKPLQAYRDAELQRMSRQFYDPNSAYHELRRRFVVKTPPTEPGRVPWRSIVALISAILRSCRNSLADQLQRNVEALWLDGRNIYAITFAKGETPPVRGFWSLTLYDQDHFFFQNALGRYSLGTKNKTLRYNPDGSLTLYAGAKSPGADRESNWLPAPEGTFSLYIRAYWADKAILDGTWQPPAIEKMK